MVGFKKDIEDYECKLKMSLYGSCQRLTANSIVARLSKPSQQVDDICYMTYFTDLHGEISQIYQFDRFELTYCLVHNLLISS